MNTTTTTTTNSVTQPAENHAQELARLRRQRDGLALVLTIAAAIGLGLVVRIAPAWADPAAVTIAAAVAAVGGLRYLLRRW
ncbi:hypothetical protein WDV06_26515 [Streptomyces racemochromogenes]|uniref:Uncharacterized protein n=1 Tax=Streptomyces racemochromogenes TaxID=67353 RepID=A0ABW7PLJ3_9ACTN